MSKRDEYLDNAAQSFGLAAQASSFNGRFRLFDLAAKWLNLADRSDHKAKRPVEEHPSVKQAFQALDGA